MPKTPAELFAFLDRLGIAVTTVSHPPLFTVADSQALRGEIDGGHTKNLFLKDRKDNFFLVTVGEEAEVDLKQIHHVIGASGRVSFGKPEALMELLGVMPGRGHGVRADQRRGRRGNSSSTQALMEHEIDQRASADERGNDLHRRRRSVALRAGNRARAAVLKVAA